VAAGTHVSLFVFRPGFELTGPQDVTVPADGTAADLTVDLKPGGNADGLQDFGGIGMTIGMQGNQFVVADVVEGGPAWDSGIRGGDQIQAVDGSPVAGIRVDELVNRIRGESGTPVTIQLVRAGQSFSAVATRSTIRF
jgi:C-terminal processing protease CtpA/Prc